MADSDDTTATVEGPAAPPKAKRVPVASIHNHINIFRNGAEQHVGDVTRDEQVIAIERFIRWHERQVAIGKDLLARLKREQS